MSGGQPGVSRSIRWKKMLRMYEETGGICPGCSKPMDLHLSFINRERRVFEATWDHIVPKSEGGTDAWDNMQLLCRGCNEERGELTNRQKPGQGAYENQRERVPALTTFVRDRAS